MVSLKRFPCVGLLFVVPILQATAQAAMTFTPGHYYSTNYWSRTILEYDQAGQSVGWLTVPSSQADELRGITFGPDGLLYVTAVRDTGFAILALDQTGNIHATYSGGIYIRGNLSYGKIAVDQQSIYIAGQNQLMKFERGSQNPGSTIFTENQVFDVEILPDGNLLAASAYRVHEITSSGAIVREISPVGNYFTDIRGIEFDPATNNLFVTHLGHTGFFFQLMRIDASTGLLEESTDFTYADDLFLTNSGDLLVGSRSETPRFYSQGLDQTGQLSGSERMFVTQLVPEPSAIGLALCSISALILIGHRRLRARV
jgi:DNA-binding beta-propeller fold protein YncE